MLVAFLFVFCGRELVCDYVRKTVYRLFILNLENKVIEIHFISVVISKILVRITQDDFTF